jgi:wobble nucleotide-excising tRNase
MEYFGIEDRILKVDIESAQTFISKLIDATKSFSLLSAAALYAELRPDFNAASKAIESSRVALLSELNNASSILEKKRLDRARAYSEPVSVDVASLPDSLIAAAKIIDRHNAKSAAFGEAKTNAQNEIENHYLATISEQVEEFDRKISTNKDIVKKLTDGSPELHDSRSLLSLKDSIEEKQGKISSAHLGGAELTAKLNQFLGRSDLQFESGEAGYIVTRRGAPAKRLSEGEKTAIAFLYFVVQLNEQGFDREQSVIVIDDPISSLDSASIYQAFAFLKNSVSEAKQVFMLTHSFDFLKLLLNWLRHAKNAKKSSFFMTRCEEAENSREAKLLPLDDLLIHHPTEYHYLFKVLYGFKSDGTILSSYHVPNVARKVLETFLEFQVPAGESYYNQLEAIDFDANKKTAIFKFANDLSHRTGKGFDPALVAETQKNVTYLLEMIKAVAPSHFDGLEKLCLEA